jgi:hypothetical protein
LYTLKSDILRLEATDRRIIDVHRVLRILQAAPWQRSMLESNFARLTPAPLPTRLDRCVIELESRNLMGVGGAGVNVASAYIDSPFWKVVQRDKANLELCLQCLQDDEPQGIPRMANDTLFAPVPGADGQVQVVFPLVFLIFATFDIPIPLVGSALWRAARRVGLNPANQANPLVSIYECIDLTGPTPWYTANAGNKDRHHLKENLRQGIFDTGTLSPRAVAQLMPWADGGGDADNTVLANLVGAVKRLQADYATPTAWDPLSDLRTHCESLLPALYETSKKLRHAILQATVESVTPPPPLTPQERDAMHALSASRRRTPPPGVNI